MELSNLLGQILVADLALDQFNLGIVFNEIARWTLPTPPASWETLRDPWEWYHSLRTADSLACCSSL